MKTIKTITAAAVLAALSMPASANIDWSGFASVGGGVTTGSDEQLFGYDNDMSFLPDTLFALQGTATLSDRISVTTQLMARGNDDFNLGVEWAYISFRMTDSLTLNTGKLRLPFYLYSDSLDVAYSYHWLRTPESVYRAPFENYTGASLQHNTFVGDAVISTQFVAGNVDDNVYAPTSDEDIRVETNNLLGASVSAMIHSWTLRAGYFHTNDVSVFMIDPAYQGLIGSLNQAGLTDTVDAIDFLGDTGTFTSVGAFYDNMSWFAGFEYTELENKDSIFGTDRSNYFTAGKRFGSYTLHGTFAQTDDKASNAAATIPAVPAFTPFVGAVEGLAQSQASRIDYTSVGLRYDFARGITVKFDFTHADDKNNDQTSNLISFALQTVF
ncbi:hypothetical protein CWE12_08310 [Aliidiomarina sedimenti]|uniref:Porin n=1 Tax=Aliidiomarina sedimenti TaxID=1933879 RepID=A0ABY0BZ34_9GAMM|nr:hypothetical protein [Aliidiomarina sedimenti]RUO29956.1 hypothetical protein CWE12_08310 [Aliidiomarina sedimenti]